MGNLFIADTSNNRVRKVTSAGTITTVAGFNQVGFNGDSGPATSIALTEPRGVAVDNVGNLYIADTKNGRIRKVTSNGTLTTVAGNGEIGPGEDYVSATAASFDFPNAIAVDIHGNLFVSDVANMRIRKVTFLPTISAVLPATAVQGKTVSGVISGTGLAGVSAVTLRGSGVSVTIGSGGTSTSLPITISVEPNAPIGDRTLIVTRSDGTSAALSGFTIVSPTPTITSISPTAGAAGTVISAVVTGTNLTGVTAVSFSGNGVCATFDDTGTDTRLPITITIQNDASSTGRSLSITTSGGTSSPYDGFTVLAVGAPVISDLTANVPGLSQTIAPFYGGSFALTVNGSGFQNGAKVFLGGVELNTTYLSANEITAHVTTAALSSLGMNVVKVVNPGNLMSNNIPFQIAVHGDVNMSGTVNIGDALVTALTVGGLADCLSRHCRHRSAM